MPEKEAAEIRNEIMLIRKGFERHIEDDKKEFAAIKEAIKVNTDRIVLINDNVQELLDIIKALSLGKQILIGTSIFIGSIIGLGVGFKTIVGWLK